MKLRIEIRGREVHDVGYRVYLLDKALELGIDKFAAYNRTDNGDQIVLAFLDGEENLIIDFQEFIGKNKPADAEVSEITFAEYEGEIMSIMEFANRIQIQQLNKGIPALLRMEQIQIRMLDKQDQMLHKQDQMLVKLDKTREDIVGEIRESKEAITSEIKESTETIAGELKAGRDKSGLDIKDLRVDIRSYMEDKIGRMEDDIAQIKAKIGI
jgi:acylphosphatase